MRQKLSANVAMIDSPAIYGTGLVDLAMSALYAGGFMLLLSGSLSITVYAIWDVSPWTLLLVDTVLALAAAGGLGFYRMLAIERDEGVSRTELQRRRIFEDSDWERANETHADVRMGREPNASRLDSVARRIMSHAASCADTTRRKA